MILLQCKMCCLNVENCQELTSDQSNEAVPPPTHQETAVLSDVCQSPSSNLQQESRHIRFVDEVTSAK